MRDILPELHWRIDGFVSVLSCRFGREISWRQLSLIMSKLTWLYLFGLTLTTTHENIQGDHIMDLEFLILNFLLEIFLIDNNSVSIN